MNTIIIPHFRNRDYFNSQRFFLIKKINTTKGGVREILLNHHESGVIHSCKEIDGTIILEEISEKSPYILRIDEIRFLRNVLAKYKDQKNILSFLIALNAQGDDQVTITLQHLLLLTDEFGKPILFYQDFLESFVKELISLRM